MQYSPSHYASEVSTSNCIPGEDTRICCRGTANYCYTKHAGVVISLGWNTALFTALVNNIPEVRKLMVHVDELLPAPPRNMRTDAVYPDCNVVLRIHKQMHFTTAVRICQKMLEEHGIVLVVCKGGNHRSPTVASQLRSVGRFVVHATLRTRPSFCFEDIASLIHACVACSSRGAFYGRLIRDSQDEGLDMQLCVGWSAANMETYEKDARVSYVEPGRDIHVLKTSEDWCEVKDAKTGCMCTIPVTWLVPSYVFLRREKVPPCRL